MNFDVNTIIFVGFLIANLVLGLRSSRGIKNITEYAIGNRKFSTAAIAATIIATWVSGNYLFTNASESYRSGLYYIWILACELVNFLLVAIVFAPRMGEFLGKLSIAEAMGSIYGDKVRIITAIAGFLGITGFIAIQLKIAGIAFEYALGVPSSYGAIIAGALVTIYSSLGGIKSVTFTDVIQFITFGVVIPVIAYFLLNNLSSIEIVSNVITTNPLFDYKQVFDFTQVKSLYFLFLFFIYAIPDFDSAIFQRISMARSTIQVTHAFAISAFTCFLLGLTVCGIGVLILAIHPNIDPDDVVKVIINDCSNILGLKGLILAGVMAMIMSTVDSYINSTAVLVIHDFLTPLKIQIFNSELLSARLMSVVIGVVSIIFSLRQGNLLELEVSTFAYYMPIVTVPFIMTILGFRSTAKSVILGMLAGFITVLIWNYFNIEVIEDVFPAMLANLVVLMGSHYLLKQPGGWVGIKDRAPLQYIHMQRKLKFKRLMRTIQNFSIIDICQKNYPKGEGLISIFGVFVMVVTFNSVNTLSHTLHDQYAKLLNVLYPIALCSSTALITYPLWLPQWKETRMISTAWNAIVFCVLICFSCLMVFISNFAEIQLIMFLVNILVISSLVRWQWALFLIATGTTIVTFCYTNYIAVDVAYNNVLALEFKIIYLSSLIGASLVLFLKPKQDQQDLTEESNLFLSDKVEDQKRELIKLSEIKNEFLRNLEHEAHTPITGITSMGQVLWESYDQLKEEQRRKATEEIAKSSERLTSLVNNLVDISKLESLQYYLEKSKANLSNLVHKRLETCQKLYLKGKEHLNFDVKVDANVLAECDPYYIARTIDNIIINAIQYSKEGTISVNLSVNESDEVVFSVKDEGIGIPNEEVYDVFGAFVVSSKTKTPAGGRGVGLALCKKVIDHHHGKIWAEQDLEKGAMVTFVMPALPSEHSDPAMKHKQHESELTEA